MEFQTTQPDGTPVKYRATPLRVGKQIDMGLELVEMISPVIGVFSIADMGMNEAVVQALSQNAGPAFGQVARALMKAGGSVYIKRLMADCQVVRDPQGGKAVVITADNFDLTYNIKGGSSEVVRVTKWLIEENFMDFIKEALAFSGQKNRESEGSQTESLDSQASAS